jgi:hypothetical protein
VCFVASCALAIACAVPNPAYHVVGDGDAGAVDGEGSRPSAGAAGAPDAAGLPVAGAGNGGTAGGAPPSPDAGGDAAATLATGLVARFAMDEGSGTRLADALGGPPLTLTPTTAWIAGPTAAPGDRAIAFSAGGWASTAPTMASAAVAALRAPFSIAVWLRWDVPHAGDSIVVTTSSLAWNVRLGTTTFRRPCFASNTTGFGTCGSSDLPIGSWVHIAFTGDGKSLRLYVDGKEDTQASKSFAGLPAPRANDSLEVAATGGKDPLSGALDEVRLYSRALSAEEIARLAGR